MSDVKYKVCKVCRGRGGDVVKGWVAVVAVVVAVEVVDLHAGERNKRHRSRWWKTEDSRLTDGLTGRRGR